MLRYADGTCFARSRTTYSDHYDAHRENRIVIFVRFAQLPKTRAIVDTAAPYCVLKKEHAIAINPNYQKEVVLRTAIMIAHEGALEGSLVRWPITLMAEEGHDVEIEGAIFIPDDQVNIPNFIGLDGILNGIRYAIDPTKNDFFFDSTQIP